MLVKIDLHTHSYYSDGTLSPVELVRYAKSQGIEYLSLTDHDSVQGVIQAQNEAESCQVKFISGTELSVRWRNIDIHIVGLALNIDDLNLRKQLDNQAGVRIERAIEIAKKLEVVGISNAYEKAKRYAKKNLITRPHFAQVLIDEQYCKNMQMAFKKYLKRGRTAFVRANWMGMQTAIDTITGAGGMAVLAHPLRYKLTNTKLNDLIADFKQLGGEGIEIISGLSPINEISNLSALCQKYDLVASVGSDFHCLEKTPDAMKYLRHIPNDIETILDRILA